MNNSQSLRWKTSALTAARLVFLLTIIFASQLLPVTGHADGSVESSPAPHRKLLPSALGASTAAAASKVDTNRIFGDKCSKSDIVINQGQTAPLPNGIPTYKVEIMNVCVTGCNISGIHVSCGWFSSARLINPLIFKRLRFDDCLVNGGKPLLSGRTVSFQYANTFSYPLSVSSVICS